MEDIVLKPGEVHFFYTLDDEIQSPLLLDKYREISSSKEKIKIDRYRFGRDQRTCLVTRGLLRFVLSRYTQIPPQSLGFRENDFGKPSLKPGITDIPIQFNLSHSKGLTACAVVLESQIGIDVEDISRKVDLKIARRFFSKQESEYLGKTIEKETFFDFWTLKESYIKAKGKGLSIPLNKFSFTISQDRTDICFDASYDDNPDNFIFFRFPLLKKFKVAITVEAPKNEGCELRVYHCIPFRMIKKQEQIQII
ncbi:Ffp [Desulforapulum autotrophicum HRM2]|uniref:Ffp n=1 Tax=Desulforapulum autotrophicum (strain ATCC 43914 / DSM 3382 / VKM B-1955 / HRM2) TaxID=177437 RepID=C0QDU7_DESAH|nr:4'-phosphopantetheinyl transferase superfamily protein [Desulforapulum autotrophicum]ACN17368.1 Ffp [Desulforapulum autotrophicum HRM2]